MAYDERLAGRIREILASHDDIREQKMFGGIAWMDHGNMCVGVIRDDLMARVGADAHEASLKEPGTRPMDFAHRPMVGMLYVAPEAVATDKQLRTWVERCLAFTATMPPK